MIYNYDTLTDLWHKSVWKMWRGTLEDDLDFVASIDTIAYDNLLSCDSMAYEFDLGRDLWLNKQRWTRLVRQYLDPLVQDGIDTLVLGCTHYPLLRKAIARYLGDAVDLVDSAENCATAVGQLLDAKDLRTTAATKGRLGLALTDPPDAFLDVAGTALGLEIGTVQLRQVIHPAKI